MQYGGSLRQRRQHDGTAPPAADGFGRKGEWVNIM
jgi:hypothetical protein